VRRSRKCASSQVSQRRQRKPLLTTRNRTLGVCPGRKKEKLMEGLAHSVRMVPLLRGCGAFRHDPFVLIDVGCSGGIESIWRECGDNLVAHGFDPMIDECERLQAAERFRGVKYHARYVGLTPEHEFVRRKGPNEWQFHCNQFSRTSASYALTLQLPKDVPIC